MPENDLPPQGARWNDLPPEGSPEGQIATTISEETLSRAAIVPLGIKVPLTIKDFRDHWSDLRHHATLEADDLRFLGPLGDYFSGALAFLRFLDSVAAQPKLEQRLAIEAPIYGFDSLRALFDDPYFDRAKVIDGSVATSRIRDRLFEVLNDEQYKSTKLGHSVYLSASQLNQVLQYFRSPEWADARQELGAILSIGNSWTNSLRSLATIADLRAESDGLVYLSFEQTERLLNTFNEFEHPDPVLPVDLAEWRELRAKGVVSEINLSDKQVERLKDHQPFKDLFERTPRPQLELEVPIAYEDFVANWSSLADQAFIDKAWVNPDLLDALTLNSAQVRQLEEAGITYLSSTQIRFYYKEGWQHEIPASKWLDFHSRGIVSEKHLCGSDVRGLVSLPFFSTLYESTFARLDNPDDSLTVAEAQEALTEQVEAVNRRLLKLAAAVIAVLLVVTCAYRG